MLGKILCSKLMPKAAVNTGCSLCEDFTLCIDTEVTSTSEACIIGVSSPKQRFLAPKPQYCSKVKCVTIDLMESRELSVKTKIIFHTCPRRNMMQCDAWRATPEHTSVERISTRRTRTETYCCFFLFRYKLSRHCTCKLMSGTINVIVSEKS